MTRNDLQRIVNHSSRRRGMVTAQWDTGRLLTPVLVWGDTVEEAGELLAETSGVPFDAWMAQAFTDDLGTDKVHRV